MIKSCSKARSAPRLP